MGIQSPVGMSLTQNDSTGRVLGSYSATGLPDVTSGRITIDPPSDILSGRFLQFTMADSTGVDVASGMLTLSGGYTALVVTPSGTYQLIATH